jgi:hypothetical protein
VGSLPTNSRFVALAATAEFCAYGERLCIELRDRAIMSARGLAGRAPAVLVEQHVLGTARSTPRSPAATLAAVNPTAGATPASRSAQAQEQSRARHPDGEGYVERDVRVF